MNCTSFREVVHELDRDGLLDDNVYHRAVAHAQACTRCARLLSQSRQLDASLKALVRADSRCEPSARVYGQMLRAFREQAPSRPLAKRAVRWLAAAAAVLILAGGALLVRRHTPPARPAARLASAPVQSGDQAVPASPAAKGPAVAAVQARPARAAHLLAAARPAKISPRKTTRKARTAPESDELEDLADFIPLPYADDDSPLGAGELVRVRLSQSTLGLLGFPVSEAKASEPVTADLVIGQDGVARAIRFVSGPAPVELVQLQTTTSYSRGVKQP
ncbi:MAG TPA: hypothetical protein VGZ29_06670 [Terriglobia bacterium]|nr:hypothetical protein [Terriglobia bacterium]